MPDPTRKIAPSRYAGQVLAARPELVAELADPAPFARAAIAAALAGAPGGDEQGLKRRLRRLRQRVLLRVMARDLSGRADLAEVCATMSDLAELEISVALGWAVQRLGAPAHGFIVVGMGKLGGRGLDVSSAVDLVFLPPAI